MAGDTTAFENYLKEELHRYRGIIVPAKANLLERIRIHKMALTKLHPNPNDEFCDPRIGPNHSIIARYEEAIIDARKHPQRGLFREELIVEKIRPDGYMILNGHHHWAAAMKMNVQKLPARIVNLTQAEDIRDMLEKATHDRRVTLDLDEVVFLSEADHTAEKALSFPFNKLYPERLRRGVPALFHFVKKNGFDVWVYTARYCSTEYIRKLFRHYGVQVDGVVTGTARKARTSDAEKKKLETMIANRYAQTLHIDVRSLLRIDSKTKEYREIPLSGDPFTWSQEVMDIVGEMGAHE